MKNNWTHERISRKAEAYQWTGENTEKILGFLARNSIIGELYRGNEYILIKQDGCIATSIKHGIWILKGEDSVLRFYSDEKFRLMYRPIDDELERLRAFAKCSFGFMVGLEENEIDELAIKHGLLPKSLKSPV